MSKTNQLLNDTFKAIRQQLGQDHQHDTRPLWQRRLSCNSQFCQALVACGYATTEQMQLAAHRYRLGMSRNGGVIFWQIDHHEQLHDGKIMYYQPDCHRDHQRHPTWVSYQLRRAAMLPPDYHPDHCLFGLHLLADKQRLKATIAVVESEKTAIILACRKPQYLWMATGGKTELSVARLQPLAGRRIILCPDTDTTGDNYRQWYDVALAAADLFGHPVSVSTLLEQQATAQQKAAKIDLADLLFPEPRKPPTAVP